LKRMSRFLGFLLVAMILGGCVHQPLVKYDEVLIYNRPFDFTYEGVLRVLDNVYPWGLSHTDKEQGVIIALNQKYWDSLDADKRTCMILVKRIGRRKTSVSLAPESQSVIGAGDILKAIDKTLGAYKE